MRLARMIVTAGWLGWMASAVAAEDVLSVYASALRNDAKMNAARYDYRATLQKIPQARAELLPQLSVATSINRTDQNVIRRDQPIFGVGKSEFNTESWQLQASQPIFRYASWAQLGQAKALVRQAFAVYTGAEQELVLRTASLYLNALAAQDEVHFAQTELAAVGQQRDLVKAQRRGGLVSVTDDYEIEARHATVEADLIAAENQRDDARQALTEMTGEAYGELLPLRGEIPLASPQPATIDEWIARAVENNLDLRARNEAVSAAEHDARRERAERYPTVELVASSGNVDMGDAVTGGGSDTDTTVVGVQVSMPLYAGGMLTARSEEAAMLLARVREEQVQQHRTVIRETRAAYQGVNSAIQRVRALERSLAAQRSTLEGKQRGYRSGLYTLLDVLDAQTDLYSTERDLARARYEYLLNGLKLKRQVSSLSEEDVRLLDQLLDRASTDRAAAG